MAEYLAPGVYVEEISTGAVPIEGVSTSTTGFVGVTARGPIAPQLVTSWTEFTRAYGGHIGVEAGYLPYAVQGFFANGGKRAYVARVAGRGAKASVSDVIAEHWVIEAAGPGKWGDDVKVGIAPGANFKPDGNAKPKQYDVTVTLGEQREIFEGVSLEAGTANNIATTLNAASRLVRVVPAPAAAAAPAAPAAPAGGGGGGGGGAAAANEVDLAPSADQKTTFAKTGRWKPTVVDLSGGADGQAAGRDEYLGKNQILGADVHAAGLAAIDEIDDVSIVCVPDAPELGLNDEVKTRCESLRYRFAVLSDEQGKIDPATMSKLGIDSSYAALYVPWVRVYDELTKDHVLVPPVGHVAGLYARTDVERGVHKAPANEVLRGIPVQDVGGRKPLERVFTKGHQDVLNPKGINVIRDFRPQGRGIRVWGARTLSSDGQWKYVNVRRLFIFVEASLDKGTQWVVFEPNDAPTWTRVVASISAFLTRVWKSGALMGATEKEAFFVRCDRTTMTQDDIDNGRLVCLIGIAPVKPAEFVILRIMQKTATDQG